MAKKLVNIQLPMGGLYKRVSYQAHQPFTTPDCSNVRPDNTLEGRERIGARPGLVTHGTFTGGAAFDNNSQVRLLTQIKYLTSATTPKTWVTKLVAVVGNDVWVKTGNETAAWAIPPGGSGAIGGSGNDEQSLTAASMHQYLFIADGDATSPIKRFDPDASADTVTALTTGSGANNWTVGSGSAPTNINTVFRYHDRLVLCEDSENPHLWYMSRSGQPLDFNFDDSDALAAIYAQNTNMGQLGEPIRAASPHGDQCVIFFCDNSTWSLRADPGFGGRLDNLSQRIGCVHRNAWCRTPEGWLFWLSQDGVCGMRPGCGDAPISVSRERIPEDLMFIDRKFYHVSMEYDIRHRGIHLYITPIETLGAAAKTHYWLDTKQTETGDKGSSPTYWPLTLTSSPTCTGIYEGSANDNVSDVLIGSEEPDGSSPPTVKQFDQRVDCEAASYIDYGPLATTGRRDSYSTGSIDQVNSVMASNGESPTWELRTGESPEEAFDATARDKGTWARHNNTTRMRIRDPYYVLRINGAANTKWAIDNMTAIIQPRSKVRYSGG